MIPIRNKKKTLKVTVEEMRNFAFAYVEKYAPSKQQLKTYLLKKYMKLSATDVKKKDVNKLIDIVLSDLEKNRFINDQFYSESKAKSMIQRGNSINKIRNYLIGKGINDEFIKDTVDRIKEDIAHLIKNQNTKDLTAYYIPLSALKGDNLLLKSPKMGWFSGKALFDLIENIAVNEPPFKENVLQVQTVIRPKLAAYHDYRGFAGKVKRG